MTSKSTSKITVRQIEPDYAGMERYWFDQNPFTTHFINAMFFLFPPGERLFVNAVKAYMPQITDPALREAVKKFIIQESNHGKTHEDLNLWLDSAGIDTAAMRAGIARSFELVEELAQDSPILLLAVTVAAEHLTAIMAATLLHRDDVTVGMTPPVRAVAIWHAIEEIEHKTVAFDVYQSVGGGYLLRTGMLVFATGLIFTSSFIRQAIMLKREGQLTNVKAARAFVGRMFGRSGFFEGMLPAWLSYFRPGFHPSQIDDRALLVAGLAKLAALTPVKTAGQPREAKVS